ncbi:MAG: hypothetical protein ACI4TK_07700 [Agathobacter sp.]
MKEKESTIRSRLRAGFKPDDAFDFEIGQSSSNTSRSDEIMEELKTVQPWSVEEKRLVNELFEESDRMWRAKMLENAKFPVNNNF